MLYINQTVFLYHFAGSNTNVHDFSVHQRKQIMWEIISPTCKVIIIVQPTLLQWGSSPNFLKNNKIILKINSIFTFPGSKWIIYSWVALQEHVCKKTVGRCGWQEHLKCESEKPQKTWSSLRSENWKCYILRFRRFLLRCWLGVFPCASSKTLINLEITLIRGRIWSSAGHPGLYNSSTCGS